MTTIIFPGTQKHNRHIITHEERIQVWVRVVCSDRPGHDPVAVRAIANEIVRISHVLGLGGVLMDSEKIMEYLLTRSLEWIVRDRLPLQNVLKKMPTNTHDLGVMILAEGIRPDNGRKLDPREFNRGIKL